MTPRDRIVEAVAALLAEGGREAVSTRAVSSAAGVQAPTIYRQFGDMGGLLDAVASHGFASYLQQKTASAPVDDPVDALRRGWDLHVAFGLANPAVYALMYADARPATESSAARAAAAMLRALVERVAAAGRLRVTVERAAQMINAAGVGVTLALIRTPPERREPSLSESMREAVLAAMITADGETGGAGEDRVLARAVALKAVLPEVDGLTSAEQQLLAEWLDRVAGAHSGERTGERTRE